MSFALDSKLAADTFVVGDFELSRVLLMNDSRYGWLILVPRRADLVELTDLSRDERSVLIEEVARASEILKQAPDAAKINVGALGNIVRQLHVHVVARRVGDAAWPGPVWGVGEAQGYDHAAARATVEGLRRALGI